MLSAAHVVLAPELLVWVEHGMLKRSVMRNVNIRIQSNDNENVTEHPTQQWLNFVKKNPEQFTGIH